MNNYWLARLDIKEIFREGFVTTSNWDCNNALGDTIMEKYESLYLELVNCSQRFLDITNQPANYLLCRSNFMFFRNTSWGFLEFETPIQLKFATHAGNLNGRWMIFESKAVPENTIIFGNHNPATGFGNWYGKINIQNFE